MNNAQFSSTVKTLCNKKSVTIKEMLAECGIQKGFIYEVEKRNDPSPMVGKIEKIADFFGVSVDYLLGRTDVEKISIVEAYALSERDTILLKALLELEEEKRNAIFDVIGDMIG